MNYSKVLDAIYKIARDSKVINTARTSTQVPEAALQSLQRMSDFRGSATPLGSTLEDNLLYLEKHINRLNPNPLEYVKNIKPLEDYPYDVDKRIAPYMGMVPGRRLGMIDQAIKATKEAGGLWYPENQNIYLGPDTADAFAHEYGHAAQSMAWTRPKKAAELRPLRDLHQPNSESLADAISMGFYGRPRESFAEAYRKALDAVLLGRTSE